MKTSLVHLKANTRRTAGLAVAGGLLLMGITLASCVRKSLYIMPEEGVISFEVNWGNLAEGDVAPTAASLYIYNEDGTLERTAPFSNGKYSATIAAGRYKALAVSEGRAGMEYLTMDNYATASVRALRAVTTTPAVELPAGVVELQRLDWIYGGGMATIEVGTGDTVTYVMEPKQLTQRVTLNFTVGGDADAVESVEAMLTGVAQLKNISTMTCAPGNAAAAPLRLEEGAGGGAVVGRVYEASALVLGIDNKEQGGGDVANDVIINVAFSNGGSQEVQRDITDDIAEIINGNGGGGGQGGDVPVDINVDVEVEVSKTSSGQYTATLTQWEVTNAGVIVQKPQN